MSLMEKVTVSSWFFLLRRGGFFRTPYVQVASERQSMLSNQLPTVLVLGLQYSCTTSTHPYPQNLPSKLLYFHRSLLFFGGGGGGT